MTFPTNIADAVSQIRSGTLGTFSEVKIGDILVSALSSVSGADSMDVTERRIEAGYTIADAAVKAPVERSLSIVLANPDFSLDSLTSAALNGSIVAMAETWRDKVNQLYEYFESKELVTLQTHRELIENMLVSVIDPIEDVEDNYDAFFATVTLRQVKLGSTDSSTGAVDSALDAVGGL